MRAFHEGWRNARPLEVVYAPRANASAALEIAERLRALIDYLGRAKYSVRPDATPARVSKILRYDSVSTLEAVLSGIRPLPFSEAELICETFGVNPKWLLEGQSGPFEQKRAYSDSEDFFRALTLDQITWGNQKLYYKLLFILGIGKYPSSLVYGQREESAYRFDLLLDNVSIYEGSDVSRTDLFHFCLAAAEICRNRYFSRRGRDYSYGILDGVSYIPKTEEQYRQILNGHVHLSWVVRELHSRPWAEDIWDLEFTRIRDNGYTPAVTDSYQDFLLQMKEIGITNNKDLYKYIDDKIAEIRSRYRRQSGTQEPTMDA